ncbi:hypothetical protein [Pseudonocardia humida]|uniref:Uncharacterized protein n=1 Tax=Pseudonocardia humida TaxID=2800819 RepID=A0ABT0ZX30_9PSEU|nr:hypothetical protein [Pseudonocardia humida]MCO1655305.1 hypothetical protein [Pseudonocardia humida]
MSRAYPFRRPPDDVVTAGPWLRVDAGDTGELPSDLPDWDYETVLPLRRPISIDGLRARRECGLRDDAQLVLSVIWASSSSSLRGRAWQFPVPPADAAEYRIAFDLPGGELGGRLDLETVLTLRSPGTASGSAAAPSRPGSVLWRDTRSVMLQVDAVLFPLAVVDFEHLPYPTGAAWHLELGHDLEAQALGSVLLLVNQRREIVTDALAAAADPADADRRVLSAVRTDVIRSLIERAVVDDEFDDEFEYPTGSVGALFASVLKTTFPDRPLEAVRRERDHDPALLSTRVQSATDLLAGP